MKTNKGGDPVVIFAGNIMDAQIVKGLLNESGVEAYLKDENIGTIAPWQASSGGAGSVKVVISGPDYDKAKPIVDEYNRNLNANSHS